jgi:hypothetical protein
LGEAFGFGQFFEGGFCGGLTPLFFQAGALELLALDFVPQFSTAAFEVLDFLGSGLSGQGASAEFGAGADRAVR